MRKLIFGIMAAGCIGTGALAQESEEQRQNLEAPDKQAAEAAGAPSTNPQPGSITVEIPLSPDAGKVKAHQKASTFIGMQVMNLEGKPAGKVQDLVFDPEKGEIGYAVVAMASEGQKERILPVPLSALKPGQDGKSLVLNLSENVVAAAPPITDEELPAVDTFAVGGPGEAEVAGGSSSDSAQSAVETPEPGQDGKAQDSESRESSDIPPQQP